MERLAMRKIRNVLEQHHSKKLSIRNIALSQGIGRTTVKRYLDLADSNGLSWPLPADMTDRQLEELLFPDSADFNPGRRIEPDWSGVAKEFSRKGVTLQLLWQEYASGESEFDCYSYSQFCRRFREWTRSSSATMIQHHAPGEKMFVDYAGMFVPIHCPNTGAVTNGQVFVASLGASNYIFAEVTRSQQIEDFVGSHPRAFEFFGGVPQIVVPDNLKSGVIRASLYEPAMNLTYDDMAKHFDVVILPTRPRRPKDKAKVEKSVQVVEQQALAKLRDFRFFSTEEANEALAPLVDEINNRHSKHLGGTRRELFEELDAPALSPLPPIPYVFGRWLTCLVGVDYHVKVEGVRYSVPHSLIRRKVQIRCTDRTVEIFHRNERIHVHERKFTPNDVETFFDHMPENHKHIKGSTPEKLVKKAESVGPHTEKFVRLLIRKSRRPEPGCRASRGVLSLAESYGRERMEAACELACEIDKISHESLKSILKSGVDVNPPKKIPDAEPIVHSNIRGPQHYN